MARLLIETGLYMSPDGSPGVLTRREFDSKSKLSVLVVDDDPDINELVSFVVSSHERVGEGRVFSAGDIPSALEIINKAETVIDLLLIDWFLPNQDNNGLGVIRLARKRFPEIQVVVISAVVDSEDDIGDAMKLGLVNKTLQKPFDIGDLHDIIDQRARFLQEIKGKR